MGEFHGMQITPQSCLKGMFNSIALYKYFVLYLTILWGVIINSQAFYCLFHLSPFIIFHFAYFHNVHNLLGYLNNHLNDVLKLFADKELQSKEFEVRYPGVHLKPGSLPILPGALRQVTPAKTSAGRVLP